MKLINVKQLFSKKLDIKVVLILLILTAVLTYVTCSYVKSMPEPFTVQMSRSGPNVEFSKWDILRFMNGFIDLKNNEKFSVKDIEKLVTMIRDRMYKDMDKSVTFEEVSKELEILHKEVYNATKDMPRYLRPDWVLNVSKVYNNSKQLLDKKSFMYMCILLVQLYFLGITKRFNSRKGKDLLNISQNIEKSRPKRNDIDMKRKEQEEDEELEEVETES